MATKKVKRSILRAPKGIVNKLSTKGQDINKVPLRKILISSFFISVINLIISFSSQSFLPPQIPLWRGLPVSEEQLTPSIQILIPGLVGISISTVNTILIILLEDNHLKKILVLASFFCGVICLITALKIITLTIGI